MKLLFENWRNYKNSLLTEGMKTVADIPDGTKVRIWKLIDANEGRIYQIKLVNETHDEEVHGIEFPQWLNQGGDRKNKDRSYGPEGDINLIELKKCTGGGIFEIHSDADKGWGPFLYDLAIEWATSIGKGAMSARLAGTKSSPAAVAVWDYYLSNRNDVKHVQMDNPDNFLTPDPDDNCLQPDNLESYISDGKLDNEGFKESPLTKVYSKEPTTLEALSSKGILIKGEGWP